MLEAGEECEVAPGSPGAAAARRIAPGDRRVDAPRRPGRRRRVSRARLRT